MNQSTFLISRFLIEKYPELKDLSGSKVRELLHDLLKDPLLWKKLSFLESMKYTKQYQPVGLLLKRVDFYPYPEDWCLLSILSNGTGYSRCYIFIYLLEYKLGERKLENDGTLIECRRNYRGPHQIFCGVGVDIRNRMFQRKLKTNPQHPQIPIAPLIWI